MMINFLLIQYKVVFVIRSDGLTIQLKAHLFITFTYLAVVDGFVIRDNKLGLLLQRKALMECLGNLAERIYVKARF